MQPRANESRIGRQPSHRLRHPAVLRATQLVLSLVFLTSQAFAQEDRSQKLWDLERLSQPPKAEWGKTVDLVQGVYFQGEPFNGKPTRVFAYVGRPDNKVHGNGPFPAVVLVHGGGGQAFDTWARHWAQRGYVSISMDTAGCGPGKRPLPDGGPDQSGETKFREFTRNDAREMWTYHAVSDVVLSHSLIRSLPEVDAERTALTGISWGGYLTCITAGVDSRFKAAVPVYGCGFLGDNSVWKDNQLATMTDASRRLWLKLFDPGQHVGRTSCPIMFLNGTNDFAYPLDSYRKTIEQVKPELVTTAIHVKLRHGHIWTFGVVDAFIDSVLRDTPSLPRVGEPRVSDGKARATVSRLESIQKVQLHYSLDSGRWQEREWQSVDGTLHTSDKRIEAELPKQRPLTFFLQVTNKVGLKTGSNHFELPANSNESNASVIPAPKLERDFYDWHRRHADILRIKREIDPEIVLIGDSITHMWAGRPFEKKFHRGVDSWKQTFGDRALNLGFGWDRTQNVLWRIDHGELDGLNPKTVVIHIGTNNLAGTPRHERSTPAEVVSGIKSICMRVRSRLPRSKLIVMGVFPRGKEPTDPNRNVIAEINRVLEPEVQKLNATFLDITQSFLEADGTISREVMGDYLHPSERGYQIWADALKPHLNQ